MSLVEREKRASYSTVLHSLCLYKGGSCDLYSNGMMQSYDVNATLTLHNHVKKRDNRFGAKSSRFWKQSMMVATVKIKADTG